MISYLVKLSNLNFISSIVIIISILSVALLDVVGISLFFLFINNFIIGGSINLLNDNLFLSSVVRFNSIEFLIILSIIYIIKFVVIIILQFLISRVALKKQYELKINLLNKIVRMNLYKLLEFNNAKLLNIFSNHMNIFSDCLESYLKLTADIFFILVLSTFLLFINTQIFLSGVLIMIFSLFLIKSFLTKKIELFGLIYNKALHSQFIKIKEFIVGAQVIKLFQKEKLFLNMIIESAYNVYINSLKRNILNILPRQIFELVAIFFIILITGFMTLNYSKDILISTVSVFVISLPRLIPILNSIIINLNILKFGKPAISELFEIYQLNVNNDVSNQKIIDDFKELNIENLKFKFNQSKDLLFHINSFSIKRNEIVGIIGESGVGKSTFINLIIGNNFEFDGNILIDNKKYSSRDSYLLNNVALVPQENFIFEGNIEENITFETNRNNIDKNKLNYAIELSQLKDFYEYNKNKAILDMGKNISGGQKQRINIARAFYFNKNFLVFDEPSSSLDVKTEDEFINVLNENKNNFTILIITHRNNILKICNSIYKFENKKLIKIK